MKQTLEYLESFAVMALLATGLTGAAFHLFRDGGWIEIAGGSLWTFMTESPLLALGLILCAVVLTCMWQHSLKFQRQNGKAANVIFYLMLASGAYFLGHLLVVGSL